TFGPEILAAFSPASTASFDCLAVKPGIDPASPCPLTAAVGPDVVEPPLPQADRAMDRATTATMPDSTEILLKTHSSSVGRRPTRRAARQYINQTVSRQMARPF